MLFGGAVVLLALGFHVIFAGEPQCLSRFDYDEKMLLKLLRIEDKIEHIEQVIHDMKSAELENLKQTDQQLQMKLDEHSNKTATLLDDFQDNISMLNASMGLINTQIEAERGPTIAFLVRNPTYKSPQVVFKTELLNEGNAFTLETGEFLAPVPGLYYFSFNLLPSSLNTHMYCYFYKNLSPYIVYTYADGTSSSHDSGSMSVFITLKKGDIVHVRNCMGTPSVSFDSGTALTGALIKVEHV